MSSVITRPAQSVLTEGELPQVRQFDPLFATIFLSAASILVGFLDPIHTVFEPRLTETLVLISLGVALSILGTVRRSRPFIFAGAGLLLLTTALGVFTQPSQLNVSIGVIWPLRIGLVLIVVGAWVLLMQPVQWLRRAFVAFLVPTGLVLMALGGPSTVQQMLNANYRLPRNNNFAPFYLAINSRGELFATDLDGAVIWLFDSSGSPKGTISPARAPSVGTPGPGIMPSGYEASQNEMSAGVFAVPTPTFVPLPSGQLPRSAIPHFDFCGIATDKYDNLYTVDVFDPSGYRLLRFDPQGNLTGRWPTPDKYNSISGCIAADDTYVYLSSADGNVFAIDDKGKVANTIKLGYQPLGISPTRRTAPSGGRSIVVLGPNMLEEIEFAPGHVGTRTLTPPPAGAQMPILVTRFGELIMTDHQDPRLVRIDLATGKVLGQIGKAGVLPGDLGDVGGLAEDSSGRIYAADYRHRVVQRFTRSGKVDAVWWAQSLFGETEFEEEGP